MEKIVYLLWTQSGLEPRSAAAALRAAGARQVRLNVADADVKPAVGLRQQHLKPPPDAIAQVWVDSAIRALRAKVDEAIASVSTKYAAFLVTESQPLRNLEHPPAPGARTHGFAQIAILRKPGRLAYAEWLDIWHNSHTFIANDTQSTFEYVQNVVVRALSPDAPAIDAIVEECFPPEAMTDYKAFFDAPGDEPKFKRNLQAMMQSVHRFIEHGSLDVIPTSQFTFD